MIESIGNFMFEFIAKGVAVMVIVVLIYFAYYIIRTTLFGAKESNDKINIKINFIPEEPKKEDKSSTKNKPSSKK